MAHLRRQFNKKSSNKSWSGIADPNNAVGGPGVKVLLGSLSLSNPNIDETLLRVVGSLSVNSDQTVASERQDGAFGMILVTDLAIAAGAASIPGPLTDIGDDGWFVHVPFMNRFLFLDATGFTSQDATSIQFDFKSKRIVQEGQSIAFMVETGSASSGIQFSAIFRILSMVRGTGS